MELVRRELAQSRTEARALIESDRVVVHGIPTPKPASMVSADTSITRVGEGRIWVSRGAQKLLAGLEAFPIEVAGKRALDVGASTGGFTEVLLEAGATSVVALDVGRGQLHERLRADPRVDSWEKTNFRLMDFDPIGAPFPLVVADVSFISLCALAVQFAAVTSEGADVVLLVKPQFEAGRKKVARGGIVKDPTVRAETVRKVIVCMGHAGFGSQSLIKSPIKGAAGNIEYLLWLKKGSESEHLEVPA